MLAAAQPLVMPWPLALLGFVCLVLTLLRWALEAHEAQPGDVPGECPCGQPSSPEGYPVFECTCGVVVEACQACVDAYEDSPAVKESFAAVGRRLDREHAACPTFAQLLAAEHQAELARTRSAR